MKFVALLSGGKDSVHSTLRAVECGHDLVCCAHLAPPPPSRSDDGDGDDEESYMYQTAGSEAVRMQVEGCLGVPFYRGVIRGRSRNVSLVYDTPDDDGDDGASQDEVEDLYLLLQRVKREHPDVEAVSSGAILSTYQRTRIEHVCSRLGLTSLSYLWRASSQRSILDSILDDGRIDAVLVRTACPPGLMPYEHLGRSLRDLRDDGTLDRLKDRYGMHPAGEGGEYETLVLDCPGLFRRGRLVLEETEVACDGSDDGVGVLKIRKCRVEKKDEADVGPICNESDEGGGLCQGTSTEEQVRRAKSILPADEDDTTTPTIPSAICDHIGQCMHLPNVKMMKGGLCHVSALLAPISHNQPDDDEAQAAVEEFLSIRRMLQAILSRLFPGDRPATSPRDVLFVHLYLSEMSHFANINGHYREFFGTHLPPSRSCVAVGRGALPGGRRVMMDCVLQRGSGGYLRSNDGNRNTADSERCGTFIEKALRNKHHALRRTLHVQSISTWAPVCIGPYSQANALRSSLVFLAGMVGLVPQTMKLVLPDASSNLSGWEVQLYQGWKNAASVLDGLEDGGGRLDDCLGGLVYLSAGALESFPATGANNERSDFPWRELWRTARCICVDAVSTNAGIVAGSVDGTAADIPSPRLDPSLYDEDGVLYGGYEDEETWREMSGSAESHPPSSSASDDSFVPLLMVCLPELPACAEAEVELVLASRRAASCLGICNGSVSRSSVQSRECAPKSGTGILWDTGYDHVNPPDISGNQSSASSHVEITSASRFVGLGCACVSTVMATWKPGDGSPSNAETSFDFDVEDILSRMIDASINNAKRKDESSSLFTVGDVLNVRLYYRAASVSQKPNSGGTETVSSSSVEIDFVDDGSVIRTHLHSALRTKCPDVPAYAAVPVLGMHFFCEKGAPDEETGMPLIAMQVTMADMPRMETEMWVRHNRKYEYDN